MGFLNLTSGIKEESQPEIELVLSSKSRYRMWLKLNIQVVNNSMQVRWVRRVHVCALQ